MSETDRSSVLTRLQQTRLPLWVSLALAALVVVVYAWQQVSVSRAGVRLEAERTQLTQQLEADRAAIISQAKDFVARQADAHSHRFGLALAWAVRGETIRNNLEQVDQFSNELVKLPGIDLVIFADAKGKVLVASDKKHQGSDFSQIYPLDLLQVPEVSLRPEGQTGQLLLIPVMGLNSRLGTLVLRQQAASFQPQ